MSEKKKKKFCSKILRSVALAATGEDWDWSLVALSVVELVLWGATGDCCEVIVKKEERGERG